MKWVTLWQCVTGLSLSDVYTCVPVSHTSMTYMYAIHVAIMFTRVLPTGIAYMYAIPVRNTCLQFVYTCVHVCAYMYAYRYAVHVALMFTRAYRYCVHVCACISLSKEAWRTMMLYRPTVSKATGKSLSGIPGNCYVLNSWREFPGIF